MVGKMVTEVMLNSEETALNILELCLAERVINLVSQLVENLVKDEFFLKFHRHCLEGFGITLKALNLDLVMPNQYRQAVMKEK